MMIRVENSTQIDRPVDEVFAYVDDLARLPEWIDILAESVPSESPTKVGTRVTNQVRLLRRRFENTLDVVEHDPNRRMVFKTEAPFAVMATFLFEPANGGTSFTTVLEAQPNASTFFKLGEPILTRVGKRRFKGHLRRLKKRLEAQGTRQHHAARG
jgi:uncharacterized membrane protein